MTPEEVEGLWDRLNVTLRRTCPNCDGRRHRCTYHEGYLDGIEYVVREMRHEENTGAGH